MAISSDQNASGGEYIATAAEESGAATFAINIPTAGEYVVWCKIRSTNAGSDSVYVSADGGAEDVYDTAQNGPTNLWQWAVVNGRGGTNVPYSTVSPISPRVFSFTAGQHTVTFRGREANTAFDQLLVTNDRSYVPDVIFTITTPTPLTSSIALDPTGFVTVTWPAVSGKTYRVMYKSTWTDTAWTNLRSDVTSDSSTASQSDYVVGNRFYQVIELP